MSNETSTAVWKSDYFKPGKIVKLLVALKLADWSNEEGVSWPAVDTLSRFVRATPRAVQLAIREMESDGVLTIDEGGGRKSNRYHLRIPEGVKTVHPRGEVISPQGRNGARSDFTAGVKTVHPRGEVISPNTLVDTLLDPSGTVNDTREALRVLNLGFEEFYKAYPRKTARVKAVEAWQKHKCHQITQKILTALANHSRSDQWMRGIIPHPATWLNQKRWEDELPAAKQSPYNRERIKMRSYDPETNTYS